MAIDKKAPTAPTKKLGGTTNQGKNSKVDYRTAKTKFKMKKQL